MSVGLSRRRLPFDMLRHFWLAMRVNFFTEEIELAAGGGEQQALLSPNPPLWLECHQVTDASSIAIATVESPCYPIAHHSIARCFGTNQLRYPTAGGAGQRRRQTYLVRRTIGSRLV